MFIEKTVLPGLTTGLILALAAPAFAQSATGGDNPMPVPGPYPVISSQRAGATPSATPSTTRTQPPAATTIFPKPSFALPLPYWMRAPARQGQQPAAPQPAPNPVRQGSASAVATQTGEGATSGSGQARLRAQVQGGASFGGSANARATGANQANQAFGLTRTAPVPGYFPGYIAQPTAQSPAQPSAQGAQQARPQGAGTGNAPAQTFGQPYANPYGRAAAPQYGYGYAPQYSQQFAPNFAAPFAPQYGPQYGQQFVPAAPFGWGAPTAPGYLPYGYAPYGYGQQPRPGAPAKR